MVVSYFLLLRDHLRQRPVRACLSMMGVAIGVSAWMAIRVANIEVYEAFEESVESVVGRTTLQVRGSHGHVDERVLIPLRDHPSVIAADPELRVVGVGADGAFKGTAITVVGLDLLEWAQHEPEGLIGQSTSRLGLEVLLDPTSAWMGEALAADWGIAPGDSLVLRVDDREYRLAIRGFVKAPAVAQGHLRHVLVMDIASAQTLFGLEGWVTQINLVTDRTKDLQAVIQDLQGLLPSQTILERPQSRNRRVEAMLKVFQFNLTVLSTVGLLIGGFLVYNTMAFSVVQHRREIGILRTLGMSRWQIGVLFLSEAAAMGLVGGLAGCGLGSLLAQFLGSMVGQSVSDLYASVSVQAVPVPWTMVAEGAGLGCGIAVLGAARPCVEASRTLVVRALAPGEYEVETVNRAGTWCVIAVGLLLVSWLLSRPGPINGVPVFGYASAFVLLLACTLLGPTAIRVVTAVAGAVFKPKWMLMGTLAADQIGRAPGRNSVTLSALVVGLAILVGVGTMIQSFRSTVEEWIDQTMMADLIIAPAAWADSTGNEDTVTVPLDLVPRIRAVTGVEEVDPYRQVQIEHPLGPLVLVARDVAVHAERSRYLFVQGDSQERLQRVVDEDGIIISEVLAERLGLEDGDHFDLWSPKGRLTLPVIGTFYDYATDGGKLVMDRRLYHRYWPDRHATVLAVYLKPGADASMVRRDIEETLRAVTPVVTISQAELREDILAIFDRTFRVTYVLELIALSVAILGIVNTLITGVLERRREIATLRALGASVGQVHKLIMWESGLLAVMGAFLGLGGGIAMSHLLVAVINKQSFGWTVFLQLPPLVLMEALGVACLAALVAGYLPARWTSRQSIAESLRYE